MNTLLAVNDLHAYYGKSHILQGVDFTIGEGEIVALLGRNGVGRSTTCKAVMGEVPPARGEVLLHGKSLFGRKSHEIARSGIGYVPENRDIFPTLTVSQNLLLGVKDVRKSNRWSMDDMFTLFPNLGERKDVMGGALSGGEQQMLTICRALMGDPEVLMIDEPTEGLSPQMVERVSELLTTIAERNISILLVEQKLTIAMRISHRVYVMGHGRMVFEGTPEDVRANEQITQEWLEV